MMMCEHNDVRLITWQTRGGTLYTPPEYDGRVECVECGENFHIDDIPEDANIVEELYQ